MENNDKFESRDNFDLYIQGIYGAFVQMIGRGPVEDSNPAKPKFVFEYGEINGVEFVVLWRDKKAVRVFTPSTVAKLGKEIDSVLPRGLE